MFQCRLRSISIAYTCTYKFCSDARLNFVLTHNPARHLRFAIGVFLVYGAQSVPPNFSYQVSFPRRQFSLARLFLFGHDFFLLARLSFFGTTFCFRHDSFFWARLFFGHDFLFSASFFFGTTRLSHFPAGLLYCLPLRKIITPQNLLCL